MAEQVERLCRSSGGAGPAFWVDVHVSRTSQSSAVRAADLANSAWVNDQIEEVAARHPLLRGVPLEQLRRLADDLSAGTSGTVCTCTHGQSVRNSMIARTVTRA